MARIKAIFDADILIHLVKTKAMYFAIKTLGMLYVSDYVYQQEIKKDTFEGKQIEKLKSSGKLKIIEFSGLTEAQKRVYRENYKLLKKEDIRGNPINEGERVTACLAKAVNIYYYMSDDNKAAPYIRSLVSVDIINFSDILFLYLVAFKKSDIEKLRESYRKFLAMYDSDKTPKIFKCRGIIRSFEEMMGVCFDKFQKNDNLKRLLDSVKENAKSEVAADGEES